MIWLGRMEKAVGIEKALLECLVDKQGIEDGKNELTAHFVCPPDFPAFDGHFPGNPILPAFVQLTMVRLLVQLAVGKVLLTQSTGRIKFGGMVRPLEMVRAEVCWRAQENSWDVKFVLKKGDDPVASGGLVYREK